MPTETGRPSFDSALPYVVAGIAAIVGLLIVKPYAVGVFHDDGAYAILAQSVAEGRGFRFLQLPGEPFAIHYPPGYPLLLAVLWWITPAFPANLPLLLSANALFLGATAWGVHRLGTRILGWDPKAAAAAALAAALSFPLLLLTGILVSEPMFIAATLAMLVVSESMVRGERPRWQFVVFGLGCGALALIRTHGLSLPMAVMLLLAWRRRRVEAAACAAGVLIALAPWQIWQGMHGGGLPEALRGSYGSYTGWFVDGLRQDGFLQRTLATNTGQIIALLAGRFAFTTSGAPVVATALLAAAVLAFGAYRVFRRAPVTALFFAIYLGIVMLWPYQPWRFVFGIWPLAVICLGEALRFGIAGTRERSPAALPALVAALVVGAGGLLTEGRAVAQRSWEMPARTGTQQTVPSLYWILRNTKPNELVASEAAELVYLYTGRHSVPVMPFEAREYGVPRSLALDGAGVRKVVETLPVDYVATISRDLGRAAAAVSVVPGSAVRLSIMDSVSGGGMFRVIR